MSFEGSKKALADMLRSQEIKEAFKVIEEQAAELDSTRGIEIGSVGWELKVAERAGQARGLLMAIDTMNDLANEEN